MDFDLEGLPESDTEDFCFPEYCILDPGRDLVSLVGNADEAHPELSSSQTLTASLRGGKERKHHKQQQGLCNSKRANTSLHHTKVEYVNIKNYQ